MKQEELAAAIGVSQATVSKWERGDHEPDFSAMIKVAELAGYEAISFAIEEEEHKYRTSDWGKRVVVVGKISHDDWSESPEFDEDSRFEVQIPTRREWEDLNLEGFVVGDDTAAPYISRDSVVFTARFLPGDELRHEDKVIIARKDDRELFEVSLREVYINKRGETYFQLLSEDPSTGLPLKLADNDLAIEGIERISWEAIRGIVVASFSVDNPDRFLPPPG